MSGDLFCIIQNSVQEYVQYNCSLRVKFQKLHIRIAYLEVNGVTKVTLYAKSSLILGENKAAFRRVGHSCLVKLKMYFRVKIQTKESMTLS